MTKEERKRLAWQLYRKGRMVHFGSDGQKPDPDAAIPWYEKAIKMGSTDAMLNLAGICEKRNDHEQAYQWRLEAALAGDINGIYGVAVMYFYGWYVDQDYQKAYDYFVKLYRAKLPVACFALGLYAEHGYLSKVNYGRARRFYREGTYRGDGLCALHMGRLYSLGLGVPVDLAKGAEYYQLSYDRGEKVACSNLGWCYEVGQGVKKDMKKALALYREGLKREDKYSVKAMERLMAKGVWTDEQ